MQGSTYMRDLLPSSTHVITHITLDRMMYVVHSPVITRQVLQLRSPSRQVRHSMSKMLTLKVFNLIANHFSDIPPIKPM